MNYSDFQVAKHHKQMSLSAGALSQGITEFATPAVKPTVASRLFRPASGVRRTPMLALPSVNAHTSVAAANAVTNRNGHAGAVNVTKAFGKSLLPALAADLAIGGVAYAAGHASHKSADEEKQKRQMAHNVGPLRQ